MIKLSRPEWENILAASRAQWIWDSKRIRTNSFAYLRKEVELDGEVIEARACVSAHHYFHFFVNGVKVGGYGSPVPSDPWKSKYVLEYDLRELLRRGSNCLASVAHYLGGSGQNYVNGLPGFYLHLHVLYADGRRLEVITDETWQALRIIPHREGTRYQQQRRISAIERYDARNWEAGWMHPGYPSDQCVQVVRSKADTAGWQLKLQRVPEGAVEEIIVPTAVGLQKNGLQVFDTGKIVSGWPTIHLPGIAGTKVRFRYSENLDNRGRVGRNVCNETSDHYYDEYTMRGDTYEGWSPCFSYKAFRYVEVTGYPDLITQEQIAICSAHTDLSSEGAFRTSSELINQIYDACMQTQKNNMLGQLVDCPHREQAQYLADTDLQAETLLYNFQARSLIEKTLSDFADAQEDDGTFPFVFPANVRNTEFALKIPEWDLHYCSLLWKLFDYYGDRAILAQYLPFAMKMLRHYAAAIDETGLIPKGEGWHISDWPYPVIDESGPYLTVQNLKFYHMLMLAEKMSLIMGQTDQVDWSIEQAGIVKAGIMKHLFDSDRSCFRDSYGSDQSSQGTNVLAIEYGIVPSSDRNALLQQVTSGEWTCKTVLTLNLMRIMFENGAGQAAYQMIDTDRFPSWGYMVAQGYRTVWEGMEDKESHCHAWHAYPARLLAEYVVGIRSEAPGFRHIGIRPFVPGNLSFAEAGVITPHGKVHVGWRKTNTGLLLECRIPAGCLATVMLPIVKGSPVEVLEDKNNTVLALGIIEDTVRFRTGQGHAVFLVHGFR
ncbi:glycoside hydrolase family 78 protein [Paenibacillus sp. HWE-109]|uniref:alpha-L-rhamnosidase n=1 Tax=Paenibacillus sp. HWE-109 TaxID=1306526 RepID=UPI001EDD3F28|nr:alpha-L-rhamnosidase [Paenibacillus sp. HWE-109]UKS27956.1 glycoside hydrolase family 78 protein [Paenibacillus sp. HWE-109]